MRSPSPSHGKLNCTRCFPTGNALIMVGQWKIRNDLVTGEAAILELWYWLNSDGLVCHWHFRGGSVCEMPT